jgi:SOS-response transcriptional repressor LexA
MAQVDTITTHPAKLYILSAEFPGGEEFNIGILLEDPAANQLYVKMRRDWDAIAPDDYYDYLAELETDLRQKSVEMGAGEFMAHLTSQLSNFLRITDPQPVIAGKFPRTLALLYERHIHPKPLEYQTHLPLYTLRSAAGKFLENAEVECESWVEAPPHLRLTQDMFVAEIQGTSMEPLVRDGDLAIFRRIPAGSRNGKRVLVEESGRGGVRSYTLKKYVSRKQAYSEDSTERVGITLEPLNPEHEAIVLDTEEDRYQIIAEFVETIE